MLDINQLRADLGSVASGLAKRGVTLDLERPDGREAFGRLVAAADVLIDNHAPDRLESLGLGWDELHRQNPDLILATITPYGRTGPRAQAKGGELTSFHAGGLGNLLLPDFGP